MMIIFYDHLYHIITCCKTVQPVSQALKTIGVSTPLVLNNYYIDHCNHTSLYTICHCGLRFVLLCCYGNPFDIYFNIASLNNQPIFTFHSIRLLYTRFVEPISTTM